MWKWKPAAEEGFRPPPPLVSPLHVWHYGTFVFVYLPTRRTTCSRVLARANRSLIRLLMSTVKLWQKKKPSHVNVFLYLSINGSTTCTGNTLSFTFASLQRTKKHAQIISHGKMAIKHTNLPKNEWKKCVYFSTNANVLRRFITKVVQFKMWDSEISDCCDSSWSHLWPHECCTLKLVV